MADKKFSDVQAALQKAFPVEAIQWKPQVTTRDKKKAMAAAFVDPRMYEDRLNEVCPDEWHMQVTLHNFAQVVEKESTWNEKTTKKMVIEGFVHAVVALTVCGVTRTDVGESPANDPNAATSAVAQGFKRACSSFGLGRYLYSIPKLWDDLDEKGFFTKEALSRLRGAAAKVKPTTPPPGDPTEHAAANTDSAAPAPAPANPGIPPMSDDQKNKMAALKKKWDIQDNSELDFFVKKCWPNAEEMLPPGETALFRVINSQTVDRFLDFMEKYGENNKNA